MRHAAANERAMGEAGIQPFFFGPKEKSLYGCYDRPRGEVRSTAVLLCYPEGPEYFAAHRGFRQLAARLAQNGFPVLRFDYFGSGDSSGESMETSLTQMQQDLRAALVELRRRSRCSSISLVGQRLGASLIMTASFPREEISRAVLWDPVIRGTDLVREMVNGGESRPFRDESPTGPVIEYKGFPLTISFRDELGALDASTPSATPAPNVLVVESTPGGGGEALSASYRKLGTNVEYVLSEAPPSAADDGVDRIAVPAKTIGTIVSWMSKGSR